ncbi:MAG: GNAT family N-acetyltransferase [Burkholderiaceae bacterium]|nr:GNAT family N-acetyltransferase [Burkholderiaceae bacterium]
MRTLYTLAYPTLTVADQQFLRAFRGKHDQDRVKLVVPHFTLLFGCKALPETDYLQHVQAAAKARAALRFCCRYAMLGADDEDDTAYVFLVPDEGWSDLSLLHDSLYAGAMAPWLRLDLPYVPHITIGSLNDRRAAKQLCDELNARGICIEGEVTELSVVAREGSAFKHIASYPLQVPGTATAIDLSFASAHATDFEALLALRITAMRESLERIGRFDPARARERFAAGFAPEHTRHILLDGERVGFVVVTPQADALLLDHFYIAPGAQGQGIGAAVLLEVFAQADAAALPVRVGALRDSASNRFYLRHGFELVERAEFDNYYVRPGRT